MHSRRDHTEALNTTNIPLGEEVRIANFATFKVVDRAPRTIQSTTGEMLKGIAGKRVKVRMSETVRRVLDPAFRPEKKN